ncbi:hypothetical protein BN1221_01414 [Brenneria goodwinii]|uniref:Uncharacterized protein n=1 Tax=Brenneria goodwinii TaxID=1109412 RepID=A0A0G4JTE7_9GAMM|nr:hypothetical protein BN1221_01414 [Brenneria goodwinii]
MTSEIPLSLKPDVALIICPPLVVLSPNFASCLDMIPHELNAYKTSALYRNHDLTKN